LLRAHLHASASTAPELARDLGVARQVVHRWATGRTRPSLDDAIALEGLTAIAASTWCTPERR
jgi:transcriptional regulator with XRE-family HTH domain